MKNLLTCENYISYECTQEKNAEEIYVNVLEDIF